MGWDTVCDAQGALAVGHNFTNSCPFSVGIGDGALDILLDPNNVSWLNSGGFGIGTTNPSSRLHVNGNICASGAIGASSDARFKKNVGPLSDSLSKIEKLRGVFFSWKHDEYPDREFSEARQIGFIAQEVQEVVPEAVIRGRDGFYSVDYGRLVPVVVEAVKEMDEMVRERDARIAALHQQISELSTRLEQIDAMFSNPAATPDGGGR
jgi:hypothetical protein